MNEEIMNNEMENQMENENIEINDEQMENISGGKFIPCLEPNTNCVFPE